MNEEPKTIFDVPVELEEMIAPAERSEMASGEALIPVRRGDRAGEFRTGRGHSAAGRLRRDLLRAGVTRHQCIRGAEEKPVRVGETCCPNMASDPLFAETAVTRPVDFHSFRRAFSTALAAAGINSQQAMRLASHSDEKTHMRYVMTTPAMKAIPAAVIPRLPGRLLPQKKQVATIARRSPRNPSVILVGRPGLEPGTYGLRGTLELRRCAGLGRFVTLTGPYGRRRGGFCWRPRRGGRWSGRLLRRWRGSGSRRRRVPGDARVGGGGARGDGAR